MKIRLDHPEKNRKKLKLIIIGIVLAILFVGLFWFKNYWQKNEQSDAASQINQTENGLSALPASPQETYLAINDAKFQIIDIRPADRFELKHIESSINIPLDTDSLDISSQLLSKEKTIIIVEDPPVALSKTIAEKLSESGYQAKYLQGGLKAFSSVGYGLISYGSVESSLDKSKVSFISAQELFDRSAKGESFVFLDVRKKEDYAANHIENSVNIPLEMMEKNKKKIPFGKIIVVDENPVRSFQGAVRLFDMNIIGVYCLEGSLSDLQKIVEEKNNTSK